MTLNDTEFRAFISDVNAKALLEEIQADLAGIRADLDRYAAKQVAVTRPRSDAGNSADLRSRPRKRDWVMTIITGLAVVWLATAVVTITVDMIAKL